MVTRRLKATNITPIPDEMMKKIVSTLFVLTPPQGTEEVVNARARTRDVEEIPPVSPDEIRTAAKRMRLKKAPGVDKIPAAIIRILGVNAADNVAGVFTQTLNIGFPPEWKRARLICFKKPNKAGMSPGDYRPISILPAISKLWEYVIKARIDEFLL